MFWTKLIISAVEFLLSLGLSILIVYWSYRSFIRFNREFDAEKEIYQGNPAVAIMVGAMMFSAALIMRESIYPVIGIVTVGMTEQGEGHGILLLIGYALGHLVLGFLLSVGCVQIALKFFERLTRDLEETREIKRGNTAVAVILAGVVIIISVFMKQGVGALGKSLIPQPTLGTLRVMD